MKKIVFLTLVFALCLTLCACGSAEKGEEPIKEESANSVESTTALSDTELQNWQQTVEEKAAGMTKLEFGTSMDAGEAELTVVFTDVSWENSGIKINFDITNNGTTTAFAPRPWTGEHGGFCYTDVGETGFMTSFPALEDIEAGETVPASFFVELWRDGDIQKTLELYGKVIGIFCFEQNDITYYIDLSEHIK